MQLVKHGEAIKEAYWEALQHYKAKRELAAEETLKRLAELEDYSAEGEAEVMVAVEEEINLPAYWAKYMEASDMLIEWARQKVASDPKTRARYHRVAQVFEPGNMMRFRQRLEEIAVRLED